MDRGRVALVTNATGFAGPPAVAALATAGFAVVAQDAGFADADTAAQFVAGRAGITALGACPPEEMVERAAAAGRVAAVVSNDHAPAPAHALAEAPLEDLSHQFGALVEAPFRVVRAAIPHLAAAGGESGGGGGGGGNVVMITSNRMRLPLAGGAFPDAARAAANAMVRALAIEAAREGVIVNAVAPNFLYSEAYYPAAIFRETEEGRAYVRAQVPAGRLAEPEEIGEVIAFLATARTRFLTGAVIDFAGGWPFGPARPTG